MKASDLSPLLALLLCASAAQAACPPAYPAHERVRIVECTDGSYALEMRVVPYSLRRIEGPGFHFEAGGPEWQLARGCGMSLWEAKQARMTTLFIESGKDADECPPPRPEPKTRVVVE